MVYTRQIQVRVSREQHERITALAYQRGFSSVASFVRFITLHQDLFVQQKILEIHRHLLGEPPRKARRKAQPRDYPPAPLTLAAE